MASVVSNSFWRVWQEPCGKWVGKKVCEYSDGVNMAGSLCEIGYDHPRTGKPLTQSDAKRLASEWFG